MGALAATAAIAAPSIVPPESKDRDPRLNGGAESSLIVAPETGEVARSSGNMSAMPARGFRADPPVPGGGCQANGDFTDAAGGFTGFSINSAAFMRADNFRPSGTGAVSLTAVSWTGWAQQGAAPNIVAPVAANQPAQFVVTIFSDINGMPGAIIGTAQTVTPTRTASTQTIVPGANNPALALQDYTVTLPTAVPLTGQTCYWIEIRPVTLAAGVTWLWRSSNQGDGVHFRRTVTTPVSPTQAYPTNGIRSGDLSFCTNLALVPQNTGTSCAVNSTMACAAPGTAQTNCQVYDGTGTANFSTKAPVYGGTPAGNCIGAAVTFRSADNFTINAPGNINSGCFQGVIVLGAATTGGCPAQTLPTAVDDSFDISVYTDAGSPTSGVPGTLIATRTVTPSDGALTRGGDVTNQFANSFNWSYNLSTHSQGPIVLPTSGCYWIEIVYNSQTVRWAWFIKSNARPTGISDNFRQTQASTVNAGAYNLQSQQFSGDFAWCMNISQPLVRSTSCVAVPTQTNTACATATTLALGGVPLFGQNLAEGTQIPFSCASRVPNFNGLWYRVVGNGQDVTVSTCNTGTNPLAAATNFDTVISVFCTRGTDRERPDSVSSLKDPSIDAAFSG
ncbi:MAG: hypothetical protein K2Q20_00540, partial [Phycisphaerales bacterium]|nr:hypothetical protein [Phycisphaerales bacterium]